MTIARDETKRVLDEVLGERVRQDRKFGQQDISPTHYLAVLAEEFGEAAKEVVEYVAARQLSGPHSVADERLALLREELVQTAAVAVAFVERLDRMAVKP